MKTGFLFAALMATTASFGFSTGNLVVMVIGDGGDTAGNQPTVLREFTTAGVPVGTDLPLTNVNGRNLTVSYGERSEGNVQLAFNQQFLMVAGYDLPARDASFGPFTSNRVVARVDINGNRTYSVPFQVTTGDGVRMVWSETGTDFLGTGGDMGLAQGTFTTTVTSQILPIFRSSRAVQRYGNTYYFTGSNAFAGLLGVASWDGVNQVDLFPSQDGLACRDLYVENHRTIYLSAHPTQAPLVKWIKNDNGAWVEAYRAAGGFGIEHMTVDGNTIYATGSQGQRIIKTTDTGTGFTPWEELAVNLVPNTRWRGIEFAPRPRVQGTVNLSDIAGTRNGQRLSLEFWQGSTLAKSLPITLDGNGAFDTGVNLSGPYRISIKGAPFLRKDGGSFNLSIGTPFTMSLTLTNGDSDGSGEVDAADIDLVIAAFGQTNTENVADVDRSGEVDAADIDIVIVNFGATDDF